MSNRLKRYYLRRVTRSEPPPYRVRAGVFSLACFVATLVVVLLADNGVGLSLGYAVVVGVVLGLVMAWVLPIRVRR
jgi:hypothetical protein